MCVRACHTFHLSVNGVIIREQKIVCRRLEVLLPHILVVAHERVLPVRRSIKDK
jgi:hypothetical protein